MKGQLLLAFHFPTAAIPPVPELAASHPARHSGKWSPLVTSGSSGKTAPSRWPLPGRGS